MFSRARSIAAKAPKPTLFVAGFTLIGVLLLAFSQAAGPNASREVEGGNVTSPAGILDDQSASGGQAVQFGGGSTGVGPAMPPDATGNGLTAKAGDREVQLTWNAVSGATSYRVERIDLTNWTEQRDVYQLSENQQFKQIASNVSQTSYWDSPTTFTSRFWAAAISPAGHGRGLVNGQTYTYRVVASNGTILGPVKQMPDDGFEVPGWTALGGYKKRDARNTGHWGAGLQNKDLRLINDNYFIEPGETLENVIITGVVFTRSGAGITIRNSWLHQDINVGNGSPATTLIENTTIGPGPGRADSFYEHNGTTPNDNFTCRRCRFMWVGSAMFLFANDYFNVEDTFAHDIYRYDTSGTGDPGDPNGAPHIQVLHVNSSTTHFNVKRSNMECHTWCSGVIAQGIALGGEAIVEHTLFAGNNYNLAVGSTYIVRGNRFKKPPSGPENNGAILQVDGRPKVMEDNAYTDGTPVN